MLLQIFTREYGLKFCAADLQGTGRPDTLTSRNNLAVAYQAAGRTAEAIPLLERTLADCERLQSTGHPTTKAVRENLAALTA